MRVACFPALPDPGQAEGDVFRMVLVVELWRQQLDHVHPGLAAVAQQFPDLRLAALAFGQPRRELFDDVTQPMRLLVARDLTCDAARILYVLMAGEGVRHRGWLGAERIPEVDGEDERVPARVVVEHHFRRRVGENAAVPVEFAIDANGGKRWRQGARGHDIPDAERPIPAVEIAHLAGPYVRGADRQARLSPIDQIELDDLGERALQWRGRVVAGAWSSRRSKPPSRNSTSTALRWSRSRRRPRRTGASRCARTSFPILSDVKGKIGAAFGLRFNLSDYLVE